LINSDPIEYVYIYLGAQIHCCRRPFS